MVNTAFAFSQNTYVSKPIVDVINSGKYYMKIEGMATFREEGESGTVPISLEMATRTSSMMMRNTTMGMSQVILSSGNNAFQLDEDNKTWTSMTTKAGQMDAIGRLTFSKQYQCKMNEEEGWYCDEYKTAKGEVVRFYYNSNKVSIVDLGGKGQDAMGPLYLISFSSVIPQNMYFCLDNSWKKGADLGGSLGNEMMKAAGVDFDAMKKEMLKEMEDMDDDDLPPGMTKEKMVQQMMQQINSNMKKAGVGTAKTTQAGPTPPRCSTPGRDTGTVTNLAAGQSGGIASISGMQAVSSPVYANALNAPEKPQTLEERFKITEAGVNRALADIKKEIEGKSDEEALNYVIMRNNDIMAEIAAETATGETLEEALATNIAYPTSLSLNNTGSLYLMKNDPKTALAYFKAALRLDPENPIILVNEAESYLGLKNPEEARKSAEKALELAPNFGSAQQVLATYYFQKNDNLKAMDWLLKSAEHYFCNITAQQMFYLYTLIEQERIECITHDNRAIFDKIYSKEHVEQLKKLIRKDQQYNHQAVSIAEKTYYPWPIEDASMTKYYKKKSQALDKVKRGWVAKVSEVETKKKSYFTLYQAMGARDLSTNINMYMKSVTDLVKEYSPEGAAMIEKRLGKFKLPDPNKMMEAYRQYSKLMADGKNASILADARQAWAMMLWSQYCNIRMSYQAGMLSTEDNNGNLIGTYPQEYVTYHKAKENAAIAVTASDQIYSKQTQHILEEHLNTIQHIKGGETKAAQLRALKETRQADLEKNKRMLEELKHHINRLDAAGLAELRAYKALYNSNIKPAMEEYYNQIWQGTSFCHDQDIVNWFFYNMLVDNTDFTDKCYQKAIGYGERMKGLKNMYNQMAEMYGSEIAYAEQDIKELDEQIYKEEMTPPDITTNYLPVSEYFFDADFVIGKVSYIVSRDGKFSVAFTNNYSGREHRFNLTEGTYTCTQTYPVLTDRERKGRSDAEYLRDNVNQKIGQNMISKIPLVGEGIGTAFKVGEMGQKFGSVETSKFRSMTQDAAGNRQEMSSGITQELNLQVMGDGVKFGKTTSIAGNVKNVSYHLSYSLGSFTGGVR